MRLFEPLFSSMQCYQPSGGLIIQLWKAVKNSVTKQKKFLVSEWLEIGRVQATNRQTGSLFVSVMTLPKDFNYLLSTAANISSACRITDDLCPSGLLICNSVVWAGVIPLISKKCCLPRGVVHYFLSIGITLGNKCLSWFPAILTLELILYFQIPEESGLERETIFLPDFEECR